jgi:predicted nucleotidyltransferase
MIVSSGNRQTANQYLVDLINSKKQSSVSIRDHRINFLLGVVREWAGKYLAGDIFVSGSSAKGTSLKGSSDLDLFVPLTPSVPGTLKQIFNSFYDHLKSKGYTVRKQNVSIRITYYGLQIDFVPGKRLPNKQDWYFLYTNRREDQERTQTNVKHHINTVLASGRVNEIMVMKIWRDCNKLTFPSMYLEMYILQTLARHHTGKGLLEDKFIYLLEQIANYFPSTAVYDPSNSSNTISNELTKSEKNAIQRAATASLTQKYLSDIIY